MTTRIRNKQARAGQASKRRSPASASRPKRAKTPLETLIEDIVAIGASVPREEWEKLPRDFNENLDHYLYGSPKKKPTR